jgi:hypothetical protein
VLPPSFASDAELTVVIATLPRGYDVLPDGRIVMLVPVPGVDPIATVELREIVVVQNWFEELERLAPTN